METEPSTITEVFDDTFMHDALDTSRREIRLISIIPAAEGLMKCTMKHVDLEANPTPDYRALSYTWGPPSDTQRIYVNDQPFGVRPNLYDFLRAFRQRLFKFRGCGTYEDEVQWIWIDQICIDQSRVEERNHQVQIMSDIYRRASYVYVWLGTSDAETEAVMQKLKISFRGYHKNRSMMATSSKRRKLLPEPSDLEEIEPPSSTQLKHFFSSPYWRRLWIVQEIMLARYIRVICGETLLSWEELQRFCSTGLKSLTRRAVDAIPHQVIWLAQHALSARKYSYLNLLLTFSSNECHDPRDKVYGLQGLVELKDKLEIDYGKPMEAVFLDAACIIVASAEDFFHGPDGDSLENIDFSQEVGRVFTDAAVILMYRADSTTRAQLIETLIVLGDEMKLHIAGATVVTRIEYLGSKIRKNWRNLASKFATENDFSKEKSDSKDVREAEKDEVGMELRRHYVELTDALRTYLQQISSLSYTASRVSIVIRFFDFYEVS